MIACTYCALCLAGVFTFEQALRTDTIYEL